MFNGMVQRAREELKQRHLQLLQQQEEERKRLVLQEGEKKVEEDKATAMGMSGGRRQCSCKVESKNFNHPSQGNSA